MILWRALLVSLSPVVIPTTEVLVVVVAVISLTLTSSSLVVSTASSDTLLRWLVYNFVLNFRLGAAQVDISPMHVSLLNIQYQVLGDSLILKSYKAETTTSVGIWIFHNLHFFDLPELLKEIAKIILTQVIV